MASDALTFASFEKFKSEVALRTKRARAPAFHPPPSLPQAAASRCAALARFRSSWLAVSSGERCRGLSRVGRGLAGVSGTPVDPFRPSPSGRRAHIQQQRTRGWRHDAWRWSRRRPAGPAPSRCPARGLFVGQKPGDTACGWTPDAACPLLWPGGSPGYASMSRFSLPGRSG